MTSNAYVLGIAGGSPYPIPMAIRADQIHWVWDANRNDPVRENATLTFGRNVWQTYTANKGVTRISMQRNGNLVLHHRKGRFIWQRFQHPIDTLFVGQSLQLKVVRNSLVGSSYRSSCDGPYSIGIDDKKGFIMYQNTSGKLVQYAGWEGKGLSNVTFHSVIRIDVQPDPTFFVLTTSYFLSLGFADGKQTSTHSKRVILKITADTHESNGNLKAYSYFIPPKFPEYTTWNQAYAFFGDTVKECALRSKCGTSEKCYGRLCSACPCNGALGCTITS
ncbi:hypothetical protein MKW94_019370 [Papaver nudicaule]|uniref:Bulb-type lectin domain-containing protein n=1 Tax=Papaver nudicaule TaxID=74823 RepID=A0AA41RZT9_PAPNU|nr:hypothetical protein [Papaver nudicaule]